MTKRTFTFDQAQALQRGQAAARRAAKERAARQPPALSDEQRLTFFRTFSTAALERFVASRFTPAADRQSARAVLAERNSNG